jgi:electron transport complex protein RnfB
MNNVYVKLQQHLDLQPVGFPATASQAEIRILQHIFTPEQAEIATCLTHRPEPVETIHGRACQKIPPLQAPSLQVPSLQDIETQLYAMVKKGGIEIQKKNGIPLFANAPLVVGMYELQLDRLTPEFIRDFKTYSSDKKFGLAFMRTIPIQKSIQYQNSVSTFDEINILLEKTLGPFVILECICRKKKAIQGSSCKITQRRETCLALGGIAQSALEMGMGRKISRDETIAIIDQNQKEGLVLQPSNTQTPEFICSCCGCCCGMLGIQKSLSSPLNFWASNFQAHIDKAVCNGCGICEKRCQADAIILPSLPKKKPAKAKIKTKASAKTNAKIRTALVDKNRCLGCGLCVPTCPVNAVTLVPRSIETRPPETRQELYEILLAGKKDRMGKLKLFGRLAKDMICTGDLGLIKKDSSPLDI